MKELRDKQTETETDKDSKGNQDKVTQKQR